MKKFYILIFALLAINSAKAQWVLQNSNTTQTLHSVYFTDVNTGYAVGDSGTILKIINGGSNWVAQNSGITDNLFSVHFPKPDTGYAVGGNYYPSSSIILKTTNGGTNWDTLTSGISGVLNSVYFIDADTGYALGTNGLQPNHLNVIIKTTNGGSLWSIISSLGGWKIHPNSICFPEAAIGYVVGTVFYTEEYGIIFKTTDYGTNWPNLICTGISNWWGLNSMYFINADTGYAVGHQTPNGLIIKTTNEGTDWESILSVSGVNNFNSVYFTDASTGYVVGESSTEGKIYKTTNFGNTWVNQTSGTTNQFYAVCFPATDTGYIVGSNGTILKTINGGGDPVGIHENPQTTSLNIYPNPANKTITINSIEGITIQELTIYNQTGQKVYRGIPENNTLDISMFQPGMYVVEVATKKGNVRKKLIVN